MAAVPGAARRASFFLFVAQVTQGIALVTVQDSTAGASGAIGLPPVSEQKPPLRGVFKKLNVQIGALEQRLAAAKQGNKEAVARQQQVFTEKLRRQLEEIEALTSANSVIANQVEHLKQSTASLRAHADKLQENVTFTEEKLRGILTNLTTAEEFVSSSLRSFNMANSSEMQVLAELAQKDADKAIREAKNARLAEIKSISMSMMQTEVSPQFDQEDKSGLKDLMQKVATGLDSLAPAQEERLASLEASFRSKFDDGERKRIALAQQQADLNSTKTSLVELESRLKVAVQHLEEMTVQLQERADAARIFVHRIGDQSLEWDRLAAIRRLSEMIGLPLNHSSRAGSRDAAAAKPKAVPF